MTAAGPDSDIAAPPTAISLPTRSRRGRRRGVGKILIPVLSFAVLIGIWQAVVKIFSVPLYILPPPTLVVTRIGDDWGLLWSAAQTTGYEVVLGFLLAAVVSVPLALLISSVEVIRQAVYPLVIALQTIPKIAIAPLFIVWFGFGAAPKILLTFLLCFFPILIDSMSGFRSLDPRQLYITKSMGASQWQTFRFLRLPAALPFIFSGFKVSVVLAVTGAIVAEFVGANAGLGYLLLRASSNLDTGLIFAVIVILSVLGLVLAYIVDLAELLFMPWHRKGK